MKTVTRIGSLLVVIALLNAVARAQAPTGSRASTAVVNSIGMRLMPIPAGEFQMGGQEPAEELCKAVPSYGRQPEEFADEYPRHRVQITRPFLLGQHEVTVGQFRKFVEAARYTTEAERDGTGGWGHNPTSGRCEGRNPKFNWRNPGFPQTDEHPVLNVTWSDSNAFCEWLSRKEARHYRLPTEAEWEYASRAGTTTRYYHGNDPVGLKAAANVFNVTGDIPFAHVQSQVRFLKENESLTEPVGKHEPNAWGIHDTLGNVWEWCADWYGEDYYSHSPNKDPQGPITGDNRVRRGGAYNSFALYARPTFRNWNAPASRCVNLGFRVACDE